MHKAVQAVGPVHERRAAKEPLLDLALDKYVEDALEIDDLERVLARDVDGVLGHGYGCKSTTELIHLFVRHGSVSWLPRFIADFPIYISAAPGKCTQYINAQYQASTKKGNFLSKRLKNLSSNTVVSGLRTFLSKHQRRNTRVRHWPDLSLPCSFNEEGASQGLRERPEDDGAGPMCEAEQGLEPPYSTSPSLFGSSDLLWDLRL